ncbi:MAG: hypothetical protein AAB941_02335 [Patescibacteria group bacterium]
MFRSIGGALDKKKEKLIKAGEKSFEISQVFNEFLDKYFAEYKGLFKCEVSFDLKNGKVTINTGSKLVAGEIVLKTKELAQLLREARIKVTQIVIV